MNIVCLSLCLRCVVLDVSNCLELYQHWMKLLVLAQKRNWALSVESLLSCNFLPMSLINNYWLKCQFHKKLCFLSKNLYLFHTANQVVDASDYRDILPSIAPTKEESTWGEIGEPSNRLPPLRVLSIHSHCHLEKKENVLFYFLFLLNEKCRLTPRCKKCHLSCLLSLKLFVLLESFYLGVQKHENTSGNFFSQLTRVTKVLSLSRFQFHFNFLFYKYFYNIRDTKVLSHFLLFEFHLFFSPNIFTWHDVCPSACCNKKIIKIYCSQHFNYLNNCDQVDQEYH